MRKIILKNRRTASMEALQRHLQYCSRPMPNRVLAGLVIKLIHSTRDRTWRSSQFHFIPGSQWARCRVKICSTEDEEDFEGFKFKKETDSYAYTSLNLYILADIKWYSIIIIATATYHFFAALCYDNHNCKCKCECRQTPRCNNQ